MKFTSCDSEYEYTQMKRRTAADNAYLGELEDKNSPEAVIHYENLDEHLSSALGLVCRR